METVVELRHDVAESYHRPQARAPSAARRALDALLARYGASLVPTHVDTADSRLMRFFTLAGSTASRRRLLDELSACEAVTAVYEKPAAETASGP